MNPEALISAAVDAGGTIKTETGPVIAKGIWSLVVVVCLAILAFLPKWRVLGIGQRKDDLDRLMERIDELETRVEKADERARDADERAREVERKSAIVEREAAEHVHKNDMRLMSAVTAYQLVVGELVAKDPENAILRSAQEMMATAVSGDFGVGDGIKRLSNVRGKGE